MKIYIIIVLALLLSGCSDKQIKEKKEIKNSFKKVEDKIEIPENPISIGIYIKEKEERKLTKEYTSPFILNKDIGVFSTFYTVEEKISNNNIKNVWNKYYETYQNISSYKIGYHISFETKNGISVNKNIIKPEDVQSFYDYIQVYLYDDIHQKEGAFYTHIEEMKENTLLTSIKLTGSTLTHEIISPIILTAFTYQTEEEFDENGHYKGTSIFKTTIYDKKV